MCQARPDSCAAFSQAAAVPSHFSPAKYSSTGSDLLSRQAQVIASRVPWVAGNKSKCLCKFRRVMVTAASDTSPSNDLSWWPNQYSFCLKLSHVHVIPARLRASVVLRIPRFGLPFLNCPSGHSPSAASPELPSISRHHSKISSPKPMILIKVGRPVTSSPASILLVTLSAATRQLPLSPSSLFERADTLDSLLDHLGAISSTR